MKKEFIPYEQALLLKKMGLDEPCIVIFDKNNELSVDDGFYKQENHHKDTVLAPTFSQAFRWFRDKYNVWCWIEKYSDKETYIYQIPKANFTKIQGYHNTYEEAELECLKKLIEIVKNK